jgi:hypothetical protein
MGVFRKEEGRRQIELISPSSQPVLVYAESQLELRAGLTGELEILRLALKACRSPLSQGGSWC